MKNVRVKLVQIFIIMAICLSMVIPAFASMHIVTGFDSYGVPYTITPVQQQETWWCWAACSEMTGKFYYKYKTQKDSSKTQRDAVYYVFGNYNNQGATLSQTALAEQYVGLSTFPYTPIFTTGSTTSSYSYSTIKSHINLNKPLIAGLKQTDANSGHMVVLRGYEDKSSFFDTDDVEYIDPWDKSVHWISYTSFSTGFNIQGVTMKYQSNVFIN